jgi:endonuclease/exonuclease/phosphatase (EEP) superfamily protein YafD
MYSNVPFSETSTIFTRGTYTADIDFDSDDYNVRAFQHVVIELDGKHLHILNHHGHHIDTHKLGDDETMRQVRQIAEYIEHLDGPLIMCGDFNLAPESESITYLTKNLHNLSVEYGLQTTRSALTSKKEVCDYIFTNQHIDVHSFSMDETIISDHTALILDFDII